MNEIDTNSTETKATGIGQYFAGKTILQIIFGSAVWACVLGFVLFIVGQTVMYLVLAVIGRAAGLFSSDIWNTAILYLAFFGVWIMFFLNALLKKNRPLLKAYGTGLRGNRIPELLMGILVGFLMNGVLILFAIMHGDIHLYFDRFSIGAFLFLFVSVFIQSAAEEIMCRGFIYHRILRTYRGLYLAAALINGIFFGLIHITNNGATPIAIIDIMIWGCMPAGTSRRVSWRAFPTAETCSLTPFSAWMPRQRRTVSSTTWDSASKARSHRSS